MQYTTKDKHFGYLLDYATFPLNLQSSQKSNTMLVDQDAYLTKMIPRRFREIASAKGFAVSRAKYKMYVTNYGCRCNHKEEEKQMEKV